MKKLLSVFLLCGIFLSSFFAQEINAAGWNSLVTIHADSHNTGNHNYHKRLIFSEVSNESEDSEERANLEIQFTYYHNILSENKYIKNTLKTFTFPVIFNPDTKNSSPIFIKNRSIII